MPLAESGCPALSGGWKGKCPLLSPQRDTKNRDKGSLPGRAFWPCFARWRQGRRRQGRGSRKRGMTAGFVHRPLAAREDGAFCSRVHPISGELEPWEGSSGPLCPALPPPAPPRPPGAQQPHGQSARRCGRRPRLARVRAAARGSSGYRRGPRCERPGPPPGPSPATRAGRPSPTSWHQHTRPSGTGSGVHLLLQGPCGGIAGASCLRL